MHSDGVSEELDAFRSEIRQNHPTIQIIDSAYYGVDTFTMGEVNLSARPASNIVMIA